MAENGLEKIMTIDTGASYGVVILVVGDFECKAIVSIRAQLSTEIALFHS